MTGRKSGRAKIINSTIALPRSDRHEVVRVEVGVVGGVGVGVVEAARSFL